MNKVTLASQSLSSSTVQLVTAMNEANDKTKSDGVLVKGGKKYLQVSKRLEIFRQQFGLNYGINTEIEVNDGKLVVVSAKITNSNNQIIGSGKAEEIRGQQVQGKSHVNETSALENCETSAIGRALASLGLHGGEYASINEVEIAINKRKIIEETEDEPEDPWENYITAAKKEITAYTTQAGLTAWANKNEKPLLKLQKENKVEYDKLFKQWSNKLKEFKNA
jgi:hypothetical protein